MRGRQPSTPLYASASISHWMWATPRGHCFREWPLKEMAAGGCVLTALPGVGPQPFFEGDLGGAAPCLPQ